MPKLQAMVTLVKDEYIPLTYKFLFSFSLGTTFPNVSPPSSVKLTVCKLDLTTRFVTELAHDVQNCFFGLYQKRRQFELQHNSQHLPLPWTRNFRYISLICNLQRFFTRQQRWAKFVALQCTCDGPSFFHDRNPPKQMTLKLISIVLMIIIINWLA